jgi:ferric-dicitrate binding protein FerR (iron transport regulator)
MVEELDGITELLLKYLSGKPLDEQEKLRLQRWLEASPDNALLLEQMRREKWVDEGRQIGRVDKEKIWAPVAAHIEAQQPKPVRNRIWYRYAAAAAILLFLFGVEIFVVRQPPINYPILKNKLAVPGGQTSQLQLPDGTRVWINSGSSLEYPAVFTGESREVILDGEAYFEVTQDANHPFRVRANDQIVTVLGTSFNIRSYSVEHSVHTTLATGKVSVTRGSKTIDLKPGQQARTDRENIEITVINHMNIDGILSWKKGYFHFDDMDIPSAVYELARWYHIDVDIKKGIPDGPLITGNIQRSIPLDSLVENLNLLRKDLHIKLTGKKMTVTP